MQFRNFYCCASCGHEWTVPRLPYIIVHEGNEESDEIVVLGVFHGAQDR